MHRSLILRLFRIAMTIAFVLPAAAQESTISYRSTELAPGLHMLEGQGGFAGGNIGLLVGDDGVVMIDDGLAQLNDVLLGAVGAITKQPVDFVINTHVHGDHTGGNAVLGARGATIVAHEKLRARMVAQRESAGPDDTPPPVVALPSVTFGDAVTFHLNGRAAYVFHVAAAHTDGDALVHFRDDDVIHMGDVMFNKLFPFIDLDNGGSVEGYIAAQKKVLRIAGPKTKLIPGHGPLANRDDLQASISMLEDGLARVSELVAAGRSIEQIVEANPLAKYDEAWSWAFITTERMTRTFARELMD